MSVDESPETLDESQYRRLSPTFDKSTSVSKRGNDCRYIDSTRQSLRQVYVGNILVNTRWNRVLLLWSEFVDVSESFLER